MTNRTVRASAPLRISFVGGGTDFPHYYDVHGGAVLSATIDHAAHVSVAPRGDRQVRIRSLDLGHLVEYHLGRGPVYDGVMDLPKAAIERMGVPTGIDVDIASDAPPGSGLGGSSALVTACVGALAMLTDRSMSHREVAELAYVIEREDLGIAGGWPGSIRGGIRGSPVRVRPRGVASPASRSRPRRGSSGAPLLCYRAKSDRPRLIEPDPHVPRGARRHDRGDEAAAAMASRGRERKTGNSPAGDDAPQPPREQAEMNNTSPRALGSNTCSRWNADAVARAERSAAAGGGAPPVAPPRPQTEVRGALEALGGQFAH